MYIVPIAWIYVALMMSVAEATNSNGTVLGAIFTFLFYGMLPVGLVVYIMGTPGRKRLLRQRAAAEQAARTEVVPSAASGDVSVGGSTLGAEPDSSSHAAADAVAPVGKEP